MTNNGKVLKYLNVPECLPYHPNSELNGKPGYYPTISEEQLNAVNELIYQIEKNNLPFNHDEENEFLKLLRFLRARKFNVQQAYKMISDDLTWRSEDNRFHLRKETAEVVLECDLEKVFSFFPTWIQGFDKQNRPVSYRKFGKFEIWNILKLTTMQKLIRFHAWETEMALYRMNKYSKQTGFNIETFVLVIDSAGWNMSLATSDAFAFIKGMAVTDSDHYPERLGTLIVVNAPSVLSFAWRIIQGFLDPVTKAKIKIFSTNRAEWEPVLQQYIDVDQIPIEYGGTAPNPTPEEAFRSMNPVVDESTLEESYFHHPNDTTSFSAREESEKKDIIEEATQTEYLNTLQEGSGGAKKSIFRFFRK